MTLSDRNLPDALKLDPESAGQSCRRLAARWHGRGKLRYAVTPRFAPTCTPAMLETCRALMDELPGVYFQTHLNENRKEIAWVFELFPEARSYLDAYDAHGLLGGRSFFAHCVHSRGDEVARLAETGSRVVHCPSSNSFMGSGLFPLKQYVDASVGVCLGSDIAGGTSFSLLREMGQAYKVQMLQCYDGDGSGIAFKLSAAKLFYLSTLAGAEALGMADEIGSFAPGKAGDFLVVDPALDPFVQARLANTQSVSDALFVLATIGDKSIVRETYIDGVLAHARTPEGALTDRAP